MIKTELTVVNDEMACDVKLGALPDTSKEMQEAQYKLELAAIYQALQKRYGFDSVISIMTNATKLFMAMQD